MPVDTLNLDPLAPVKRYTLALEQVLEALNIDLDETVFNFKADDKIVSSVNLGDFKRDCDAVLTAPAPERDAWRGDGSYEGSMLRNLLARIHGDGGHYLEAHGLEKSLADADTLVATWRAAQ